jgi:hypothetical protein
MELATTSQSNKYEGLDKDFYKIMNSDLQQSLYSSAPPPFQPNFATAEMIASPLQVSYQPGQSQEIALLEFQNRYEINPRWMQSLSKIVQYDSVLVLDDSGSMRDLADPDVSSQLTRWDELKTTVKIIIEAHSILGIAMDIYFINRGVYKQITHFEQLSLVFADPPNGKTNLVNVLNLVANDHINVDMGKSLIVHLLTDGHPTNSSGQEDMQGLASWLRTRKCINKTFFSIILCCDDEDLERPYRALEYNPRLNRGVPGVDVSEDYRGESRDIRRTRGYRYKFTFGDYVVKTLVGAIDPAVHLIDLPEPCCPCTIA